MKVEITDVGSTRKEMKVVIPREDVKSVSDEIYREIAQGVAIKGFRKGKAPRHIIKMYYQDYITGELSRKLVREKFEDAVKEQNLFVVSMPEFENEDPREDDEFSFTAKFDVKPEVTPQVYTGFELKKPKIAVEDKNVDDVIEKLQETYADIRDVDDPSYRAVKGDYVILGVTSEGNESLNRDKITVEAGVRSVFPGLEHEVIGMKKEEEKEVEATFPDTHFLEDMRGKTARLKIRVQGIKNRVLPEVNDDFAKMVHRGVQTVEELKKAIRDDLTGRLEAEARTYMERQISEKLLESNTFEVPESMVRLQAIMMLQGMSQRLSAQGVRLQDIYPDGDALREESMASAEKLVRTSLLVEAIAKINAIEATEEDLEKELASLAEKYSMTPEAVRKNFEERGSLEEMKYGILERKVFDHIIEKSTVEEVESVEEKAE